MGLNGEAAALNYNTKNDFVSTGYRPVWRLEDKKNDYELMNMNMI